MKFQSFGDGGDGKKYRADSCGQEFNMETEPEDHIRKAHPTETM